MEEVLVLGPVSVVAENSHGAKKGNSVLINHLGIPGYEPIFLDGWHQNWQIWWGTKLPDWLENGFQ